MFDVLVSAINERIAAENCEDVKKSVTEMRTKTLQGLSGYSKNFYFKRSPGGLTDIEYLLQYLILCTPGLYIKCRGKSIPDTADEITGLSEKFEKLIDLKENYSFLKMLEMLIQNVFDTEKAAYPHEVEKKKLAAAYIEVDEHELDEMFRDKISINNKIFNNFLMK